MSLSRSTTPVVASRNLTVSYHEVKALEGIDVTVPEGIVMGIVGPNGSGKSTAIKAMLGLVPSTGSTTFFGQPLSQIRERIGYMPQHNSVDWNFPITVEQVVLMGTFARLGWFRRPGAKERRAAAEAMEATDIANLAHRQIGELSGGQRQRVFLSRTLAGSPSLLFMDEPFQGVDHTSQEAIVKVFHELRANGTTIVVVHHDLSTVPDLCDQVTMLADGHVTVSGPVSEVFNQDSIRATYGSNAVMM